MPRFSSPCPDCGQSGAPLIRYRQNELHYFCEFCCGRFVEREDSPTVFNCCASNLRVWRGHTCNTKCAE